MLYQLYNRKNVETLPRHYDMLVALRLEALGYQPVDKRRSVFHRVAQALEWQLLSHYLYALQHPRYSQVERS